MCYMNCPNENSSGGCRYSGKRRCPHDEGERRTVVLVSDETDEELTCEVLLNGPTVSIEYTHSNGYSTDTYRYVAEFSMFAVAMSCFNLIEDGDDIDDLILIHDFKLS